MSQLADELRAARKDRSLTQSDLAGATGIDQAHLSKFERGERVPSLGQMARLMRALKTRCVIDGRGARIRA